MNITEKLAYKEKLITRAKMILAQRKYPAELLEQIKAKRAALVKAKKLKKQKLLPRVNVDDQAFVLPASWS